MQHVLNINDVFLDAILDGTKTFEVRNNDRGFQKGDTIKFVHRTEVYEVTYVLSGWGIEKDYVCLSLQKITEKSETINKDADENLEMPIAERYYLEDFAEPKAYNWLLKQPENGKMFTLEEVEAIAREAVEEANEVEYEDGNGDLVLARVEFNEPWWSEKKKGMENGK